MSWLDDYEPVADRLAKFWADHPDGKLATDIVDINDSTVIMRAKIFRKLDDDPWATGFAMERIVREAKPIEVCETSAIGRALANAGYASTVGSSRMSREEAASFDAHKAPSHDVGRATGPLAKDRASTPITDGQKKFAKVLLGSTDTAVQIVTEYLGEFRPVELWTKFEASQIIDRLKTAKDEQLDPVRTSSTVGDDWHLQEPPHE